MTEVNIPAHLFQDVKTIDLAVEALKAAKKELQGKVIYSKKSIINKIKFNFLGYIYISSYEEEQ